MVTLIYGPETYLKDREKASRTKGMDDVVHTRKFDIEESEALSFPGFFDPVMVLSLEKEKDISGELIAYCKSPNLSATLIIVMQSVDERSKIWKELVAVKNVEKIYCKRVDGEKLNIFVLSVLKSAGKTIRKDVFAHLCERIGYESDADMTLYSVGNLLSNLVAAAEGTEIDESIVDEIVPLKVCEDRFGMAAFLDKGDSMALYSQCELLTKEPGPVAFLSLLSRDFRVAYKMKAGFAYGAIGASTKHFASWDLSEIVEALDVLGELIAQSKEHSLPESVIIPMAFQRILEIRKGVADVCGES